MVAPPLDTRSLHGKVLAIRPSGSDGVILTVEVPQDFGPLGAGRFFMLRRADRAAPAIPRPFSLYRQGPNGELEFLIKAIGPGTRSLAGSQIGEQISVIGPLGNGWPQLPTDDTPLIMLAGGIGSAPFYIAVQDALRGANGSPPVPPSGLHLIYGGRNEGMLYDLDQFQALGIAVTACTDDGSLGFHGNVVEALKDHWLAGRLPKKARLWTCGPEPMMRAVVQVADEEDLECWFSLETYMGCGVGICNGCAVFTTPEGSLGEWPVAKCCVEGPVFSARDVKFD